MESKHTCCFTKKLNTDLWIAWTWDNYIKDNNIIIWPYPKSSFIDFRFHWFTGTQDANRLLKCHVLRFPFVGQILQTGTFKPHSCNLMTIPSWQQRFVQLRLRVSSLHFSFNRQLHWHWGEVRILILQNFAWMGQK